MCEDVLKVPLDDMKDCIGDARGEKLIQHCQGICNEPLVFEKERKSISAEINYGIRYGSSHHHHKLCAGKTDRKAPKIIERDNNKI